MWAAAQILLKYGLFYLADYGATVCFALAGTTEKIFEEKKDLYDVYVDNQNVKTCRDGLKPLLRLSAADREKYRKLTEQRYDHLNVKFQT